MDPLSIALSAVGAVLLFAGLGICFLARNRWSDTADPCHVVVDGANLQLQETDGESGPSTNTELVARGLNSQNISFPGSVSALRGHVFEVFLSFRGADIRKTFADFLYHYLINLGVSTFRDSEELHVGKEIGPDLMRAIGQSKIFVPIFTRGYASSKWCLRELAEAVKWMKEDVSSSKKGIIMPIFLDVTLDEVQHQTGSYAQAFAQHEKKFDPETVRGWRDALKQVAKLKGLELSQAANGNQGEFIKLVVAEVLRELRQALLDVSEILVGLEDPAEEVMQMLEINLNDVRMVGIWGTGGIGKTTLAKYIYNRVAEHFECCSFLSDVRETSRTSGGLMELQGKLVSNILGQQKYHIASTDDGTDILKRRVGGKRALILLDDVDNIEQVKALAAELGWFGLGSRILVTTRDKEVLDQFPWCKTYELQLLDEDLALELFCKYAFRDSLRSTEFVNLSRVVVRITGRLPLSLTVIGSFLFANRGKKGVWDDTIKQLKRRPHMRVQDKLKISYDALDTEQKEIFLDIACFFIGQDYETLIPLWDDRTFFPKLGIEVLQLKSLIKIGDRNRIKMHDQLRDLGRRIVEQENLKEPELRSRLWRREEAINVITRQQGTSKIEGAVIWPKEEGVIFNEKCFQNLSKLRILWLGGDVKFAGDYQHLFPELRWLRWTTKSEKLWFVEGIGELASLRNLNISGCKAIEKLPDLSKLQNLYSLHVTGCEKLRLVEGIGELASLRNLIISGCKAIEKLPDLSKLQNLYSLNVTRCEKLRLVEGIGELASLRNLIISGCKAIEKLPDLSKLQNLYSLDVTGCEKLRLVEGIGELASLSDLNISGCKAIEKLPDLSKLQNLDSLDVTGCEKLRLVEGIGELASLRELNISWCKAIEKLPDLSKLQNLSFLDVRACEKLWFVEGIGESASLRNLTFNGCKAIEKLPDLSKLQNLSSLNMTGCEKLWFVEGIGELASLRHLTFNGCKAIEKLPDLSKLQNLDSLNVTGCEKLRLVEGIGELASLRNLIISGCKAIEKLPDPSKLQNLYSLNVRECEKLRLVEVIGELASPRELNISGCKAIEKLPYLSKLQNLYSLNVRGCEKLRLVEEIGELASLRELNISGCKAIEKLPYLSKPQNLCSLFVTGCEKLWFVEGIGELASLFFLYISGCKAIEKLPDLSKLRNLYSLHVTGGEKLRLVEGIGELASLSVLNICGCKAIEKLPDLSKLQNLYYLYVTGCEKLRLVEGIGELASLRDLNISGCKAIEKLPDLSKLQNLSTLDMTGCEKLWFVEGIGELASLRKLIISGCKAIEKLPDLSKLQNLSSLDVTGCEKLRFC